MGTYEKKVELVVDKIRFIREKKKKSQLRVANDAGISQSFYASIESHKKSPSLKTILKIADSLEINPREFFTEIDEDRERAKDAIIKMVRDKL